MSERVPVDFWDQPSTAVLVPISAVVAGLCHGADDLMSPMCETNTLPLRQTETVCFARPYNSKSRRVRVASELCGSALRHL